MWCRIPKITKSCFLHSNKISHHMRSCDQVDLKLQLDSVFTIKIMLVCYTIAYNSQIILLSESQIFVRITISSS